MITINKAKGGFTVKVTGSNNEVLSVSEVIEKKANCFKNILAQARNFGNCSYVIFYDKSVKNNWRYLWRLNAEQPEKNIVSDSENGKFTM